MALKLGFVLFIQNALIFDYEVKNDLNISWKFSWDSN